MTKVQRSDMSGNLYLFETCGNNSALSVFTSVLWWAWVGPLSTCLYTYMVLYCWDSIACFPFAGLASEPLTEAPDVGTVLVCDGPCTWGVFRNYMLVSKSVLLRALLPGVLERCTIAGTSHTAVSRSPFKHSCCGFSVRFQTLRPCCFLSSQFLKLSPQQRACKKKPLCGAAPQRARKKHYEFQEHACLWVLDHIIKFWKCVYKCGKVARSSGWNTETIVPDPHWSLLERLCTQKRDEVQKRGKRSRGWFEGFVRRLELLCFGGSGAGGSLALPPFLKWDRVRLEARSVLQCSRAMCFLLARKGRLAPGWRVGGAGGE